MNVPNSESSQIRTFAVLYQSEMDNFFKEEGDFISTDGYHPQIEHSIKHMIIITNETRKTRLRGFGIR